MEKHQITDIHRVEIETNKREKQTGLNTSKRRNILGLPIRFRYFMNLIYLRSYYFEVEEHIEVLRINHLKAY